MQYFYTDMVEVQRAARVPARHGGQKLDWAAGTTHTVDRCRVRITSTEEIDGRLVTRGTVNGPLSIDLQHADRITWVDADLGRTRRFLVEGDPLRFRGITPVVSHSETALKEVDEWV